MRWMTWQAISARPCPVAPDGEGGGGDARQGRAVQVVLIKPTLKAPGTKRLKLTYDGMASKFAFKFNLRRYIKVRRSVRRMMQRAAAAALDTWRQGLTFVHLSDQPETFVVTETLILKPPRARDAFACMSRHQGFALAPVLTPPIVSH